MGVLHFLPPKAPTLSYFVLYLNNFQHIKPFMFLKILYASYCKLSKELKNTIKIKVGQVAVELLIQN